MRTKHQLWKVGAFLFAIACSLQSCKENIFQPEEFKTGIYFKSDSTDYSFGITPLAVNSHDLSIPVKIMGAPTAQDRSFKVQVLPESGSAQQGVHFEIPNNLLIKADSVNGVMTIKLLRKDLKDGFFKVRFALQETDDFVPVIDEHKKTVITFNNRVEQPNWVDYWGDKSWPSYKLGNWDPIKYIKFMEIFAQMKDKAPSTYQAICKAYGGELLPNFPGGWAWDYDFSLTKYVVIPLYQYFMEQHPEMGVDVPRPYGY